MKICLPIRMFNKYGGASKYVSELAEIFCQKHDVHIFSSSFETNLKNISLHRVPTLNRTFLNLATYAFFSTRMMKKIKFDIVHSQGECLDQDIITAQSCHKAWLEQIKKENKRRHILNPNDSFVLYLDKHNYNKRKYKKIIAISNFLKNSIINYYNVSEDDIEVIYSGVNTVKYKPNEKRKILLKNKLNLTDTFVVLFVGWEFKRKGLEYILRAIQLMKRNNIKIFVVGKGIDDPECNMKLLAKKLGIQKNVFFVGHIGPEHISDYYNIADAFVLPSMHDAFALVVTEAMASGIPVIVSKNTGASELIENGKNGFILENYTSSEEIASLLNILIEKKAFTKRMSKNARKTAEKNSWENVSKRILKLYEEVIK